MASVPRLDQPAIPPAHLPGDLVQLGMLSTIRPCGWEPRRDTPRSAGAAAGAEPCRVELRHVTFIVPPPLDSVARIGLTGDHRYSSISPVGRAG